MMQVELPVNALSENIKSILKKKSEKNAKFNMLSFCQNIISQYPISSCICSRCLHCECKVSDANNKSSSTS